MIEEDPEGTAAAEYVGHEEVAAVVGSFSIAAISFQIDGVLGGRGYVTIGERSVSRKVVGVPIVTSLGSWRLASHDSDGLASCRGD